MGRRGAAIVSSSEEEEIRAAKRGYREAHTEGNREEEARWANVVGDLLRRRGEYVEALRWLRIDYDVSSRYLPQKQLLPTCQSIGELYFRLDRFKEALSYQKRHLQLAKDTEDLIEQQRASTQLGRTYHEIFLRSEKDHVAIRNAKKYFTSAMKIALNLKNGPPCPNSSVVTKEIIDSYNNIGLLELDLDNLEEAEKMLLQGLKLCDDEEVNENDDARSRLHHNLGRLYIELRNWSKANKHIEKDILICKGIRHYQGEAKGYINLGEMHYRVQKYDDATLCYQKALDIAKRMEDEDALVDQINQNIEIVRKASCVLEEMKKDEQRLKKLARSAIETQGTSSERKCLLEQDACLDGLIEKARMVFAWPKHREFSKRKKRVAGQLLDKEKLSDAFLSVGESYQKLRSFSKAWKWYMKSWNMYKSIGNLEGQALAKVNIGEVLDSSGDWPGAFKEFKEGYRIAVQANLLNVQMSALENMHYSQMIRFDDAKEARKLQHLLEEVRKTLNEASSRHDMSDYCEETDTDGGEASDHEQCSFGNHIPVVAETNSDYLDEDAPLASFVHKMKSRASVKLSKLQSNKELKLCNIVEDPMDMQNSHGSREIVGRKRVRVVISDDESEEMMDQRRSFSGQFENVYTSGRESTPTTSICSAERKVTSDPGECRDVTSPCAPSPGEESICSLKSSTRECEQLSDLRASTSKAASKGPISDASEMQKEAVTAQLEDGPTDMLTFKIGEQLIYLENRTRHGTFWSFDALKAEVACIYFLQLPETRKAKGLLPVIGQLRCYGGNLYSIDSIEDVKNTTNGQRFIEVVINDWVPKKLMKLYVDYCAKLSEAPNMKLLRRLYNLEVSEDEVVVSDCGLQDISVKPFLNALQAHKTIALLDVSHNMLGNETIEKLQHIFTSSVQKYGGLALDLHCNRFGPTSLFQICECSVMLDRLEVLNLSGNRLTDACSSYISTILQQCKALYYLNIEQCSITSRTIQKVTEALHEGSVLSHLLIGRNNPITSSTMINLLLKLSTLTRFSELSVTGVKLNKLIVDSLCKLTSSSCLSGLYLGGTCIGTDGAIMLTDALKSNGAQEMLKLDLSHCGLARTNFVSICSKFSELNILELNLSGNSMEYEGCEALGMLLKDPRCILRSLAIDNCKIGVLGIILILNSVADNDSLEDLHLAGNMNFAQEKSLPADPDVQDISPPDIQELDCNKMEVADSEDDEAANTVSCGSSSERKSQHPSCQTTDDLTTAIASAKQLKMLNLSRNGLEEEHVESLYSAWASSRGGCSAKHVAEEVVHFVVEGASCSCILKPCCIRQV